MANRASVPKFGTWDSDNVGYTVYFEKVRENKGTTAPPLLHRPSNPNDPEEGVPRMIAPPSRPATSSGHRAQQQQQHRRAGSSSSVASDPGGGREYHHRGSRGAEQSKFEPPPQYHPRPQSGPNHSPAGHGGRHHPPAGYGGGNHPQQAAPRSRTASPHNNTPARQRPSAVPKFGVWEEQSASDAAQGFTVQFDNLKRHREVARSAVPDVPRAPSPESDAARRSRHTPLVSKMFGCFTPHTRD